MLYYTTATVGHDEWYVCIQFSDSWVGAAGGSNSDGSGAPQQLRPANAHQICGVLMAGQGEKGQQEVAGALLKLLSSCPSVVLGLPRSWLPAQGKLARAGCPLLCSKAGK